MAFSVPMIAQSAILDLEFWLQKCLVQDHPCFFLFNFAIGLCEFHIIHPNSTYLPLSVYLLFTLATIPQHGKSTVEAVVYHTVSHCIPFCPYVFAYKYSL